MERKAGCLPIVFVWFVMRDGYGFWTRAISLIWLLIVMAGGVHQAERVLHEPRTEVNALLT